MIDTQNSSSEAPSFHPTDPNYATISDETIEMMIAHHDPKWLQIALREQGVKEIKGDEHSSRILQYHATTTLGASTDEVPWCSSFVCWVMEQAGITHTRSAASLSWLRWGKALSKPVRGCVVVFERVDKDGVAIPNRGHVGFYMGEGIGGSGNPVTYVLGGNQNDSVSITAMKSARVKSYRLPASMKRSTTVMASGSVGAGSILAAAPSIVSVAQQFSAPVPSSPTSTEPELSSTLSVATEVGAMAEQAETLATALLGINPTLIPLGTGLILVVFGLMYIVKERKKKIEDFGI